METLTTPSKIKYDSKMYTSPDSTMLTLNISREKDTSQIQISGAPLFIAEMFDNDYNDLMTLLRSQKQCYVKNISGEGKDNGYTVIHSLGIHIYVPFCRSVLMHLIS